MDAYVVVAAVVLAGILLVVAAGQARRLLAPRAPTRSKLTTYESGVDPVGLYLAACNSHDGSSAFRLLVTPVRIVCANTQAAAISRAKASLTLRSGCGELPFGARLWNSAAWK